MKFKMRLVLAVSMLACLFTGAMCVYGNEAPDSGTLSLVFEKEDSNVKIDGASVSVYKIADMIPVGESATYPMLAEYSSFAKMVDGEDKTFDNMSASASNALAKKMASVVKNPVATGVTNAKGEFKTGKLQAGMYLVGQTGKSGTAAKYKAFDPFLVSVPMYDKEKKQWVSDVSVEPKTQVEALPEDLDDDDGGKTPSDSTTPGPSSSSSGSPSSSSDSGKGPGVSRQASSFQTGDIALSGLLGMMFGAAIVLIVAVIIQKRRMRKSE